MVADFKSIAAIHLLHLLLKVLIRKEAFLHT